MLPHPAACASAPENLCSVAAPGTNAPRGAPVLLTCLLLRCMQAAKALGCPVGYTSAYAGDLVQASLSAQATAQLPPMAQQQRSPRSAGRPQDTPPSGESYGGTAMLILPADVSPCLLVMSHCKSWLLCDAVSFMMLPCPRAGICVSIARFVCMQQSGEVLSDALHGFQQGASGPSMVRHPCWNSPSRAAPFC